MPPLQFNIIGKSNGVGLSRDIAILQEAITSVGHAANIVQIDRSEARRRRSLLTHWQACFAHRRSQRALRLTAATRSEINVMLEHVWPQFLHTSDLNILIPNPEWFDHRDRRLLASLSHVWSKTLHSKQVFDALGSRAQHIGFDSNDRFLPRMHKERVFLHVAGMSTMKGTRRLLDLWYRHSHWPTLVVVQHQTRDDSVVHVPNVRRISRYLADDVLQDLQNSSLFHICPSQTEGWGHSLVEALSTSGVVITVDGPPMNELVDASRGLLVPHSTTGTKNLACTYDFDETALAATIERAIAMSDAECTWFGERARAWYRSNKRLFPARIARAVKHLWADCDDFEHMRMSVV